MRLARHIAAALALALAGQAHAEEVRGRVTDAETGEPVIEAQVRVMRGGRGAAVTDLDGKYGLELPDGTYELRVQGDLYKSRRLRNVVVYEEKGATRLDLKLQPDPGAAEVVVVEARADARTESAGLEERKRSATVQDTVSAQEMGRSADSSAGDAVKRVVSATVVGGKYVFVRGLGGRYSTTLLNGVVLPSPDPDATAVPLDIFPASLLANLTVVKSYTPDLPGSFSGGALLIESNSYPADFELKVKLSGALDSASTFRPRATYDGGSYDWLGFDSGRRALPDAPPEDRPVRVGEEGLDRAAVEKIGESFENVWNQRDTTALPNLGLGAQVGDTLRVRPMNGAKLGYLAAASYGHKEAVQRGQVASVRLSEGMLQRRESLASTVGVEAVTWGGLVNLGLEVADGRHTLSLLSLYTRSADDRAQDVVGFSESDNQNIQAQRLQFVTRALSFTQLVGRHRAGGLTIDWQGNLSFTAREEPDTRDLQFDLLDDGRRRFQNGPGSGERFFSRLDDVSGGGGGGVAFARDGLEVQVGGLVQAGGRRFEARRFRYNLIGQDPDVVFLDPEVMFSPEHIGPSFRIEERTLQADSYDASQLLLAGYARADVAWLAPLRVVGGVRYEVLAQDLTPGSPFAITDSPEPGVDRSDAHLLPALNLVYAASPRMNVRAGYSYTLARPQLRELAPFLFFDFVRRRAVSGNPALDDTRIHNADLRWELFPGEREVLAASVFYKRFRDPIEQVIVNVSQGDVSYANAFAASALGLELEARGSFAWLSPSLRRLRGAANLTLIRSEIDLGDEVGPQTSRSRPLQGQSPYVVNLDLGWADERRGLDVSLLYNVYGRRIAEVGIEGLPDVYERPFHRLDLSASKQLGGGYRLKLAGTNLLDQPIVVEQGDIVVQQYQPGVTGVVSLEWAR